MKPKKYFTRRRLVLLLDVLLFTLFAVSLAPEITGLPLHEIAGFAFFIPIFIHTITEWKWLANYIKRFVTRAKMRDRFNLLLNVALFIAVIFQIVSGLVISQVLMPFFGLPGHNDESWRYWHNQMANVLMLIVALHLALSFKQVRSYFVKKFRPQQIAAKRININYGAIITRLVVLLVLSVVITAGAIVIIGRPAVVSQYQMDDVAHFKAITFFNGTIQLFAKTFTVLAVAFVALRWLGVRL
ncbi:MAG TPA: DUF4405 domain-containing protein [Chitinophagaceae bacterium]|nr:DUF4405 domain-containing protein [Chitinophagaceae bacterium]